MSEIANDFILKELGFCLAIFVSTMCYAFAFTLFNGADYIAIFLNDFAVVSVDSRSADPLHPELRPRRRLLDVKRADAVRALMNWISGQPG